MDESNEKDFDEQIAEINKAAKKKGGRPRVQKVESESQIQERVAKLKELLSTPDPTPLTKDELIQKSYLILTMIYQIQGKDLKTISPEHTALQKTPNGRSKLNPLGLTDGDRGFLLALQKQHTETLKALLTDYAKENKDDDDIRKTLKGMYKGIPGLKLPSSI